MTQIPALIGRAGPHRHVIAPRLIAALPLVGIGLQHATGAAPLTTILEQFLAPLESTLGGSFGAFVTINAWGATVTEIFAGALLAVGLLTRFTGLMAAGVMTVATITHVVIDWENEPPIALALIVLASALYAALRGAGPWSIDAKLFGGSRSRSTTTPATA
ncbi:MAG: DoxX family protein [Planctomycetota bacterium]